MSACCPSGDQATARTASDFLLHSVLTEAHSAPPCAWLCTCIFARRFHRCLPLLERNSLHKAWAWAELSATPLPWKSVSVRVQMRARPSLPPVLALSRRESQSFVFVNLGGRQELFAVW